MKCTNCEQARTTKHWAIFQADCHGCKVRALAGSLAFFEAIQANALPERAAGQLRPALAQRP